MTPHDLIAAFEDLADAPDGVKRLRELILRLAVRGKLVPESASDESVSNLLRRLESAKSKASASMGIRRIRPLTPVGAVTPHDIPCGWTWCRLGDLAYPQAGFAFKSTGFNEVGEGRPLIRIRDVLAGRTTTYYSGEYREEFVVRPGDFLIGMDGNFNIGRWQGPQALLNQRVTRLLWFSDSVCSNFVVIALQERLNELQGTKAYTTVQHLSGKQIEDAEIPLPPLAEQHRIVARVDELMGRLDRLEAARTTRDEVRRAARDAALAALRDAEDTEAVEAAWGRIAREMDTLFTDPEDVGPLRQALLQLGVTGRLDQLEDAPLLPLNDLVDPDRPVAYGVLVPGPDVEGGVPLVRIADLDPVRPPVMPEKCISADVAAQYPRVRIRGDELLLGVVGSIGKVGYARKEWAGAVVARAVVRIATNSRMKRMFLLRVLQGPQAQGYFREATRTLAQPTLNVGLIRQLPVPVPSLADQERVVATMDTLMALCDALEARLTAARDLQAQFAAAAVHHLDV